MKFLVLLLVLTSSISFAAPAVSAAPEGKKVHKEIKSGVVVVPAAATVASADKSKAAVKNKK